MKIFMFSMSKETGYISTGINNAFYIQLRHLRYISCLPTAERWVNTADFYTKNPIWIWPIKQRTNRSIYTWRRETIQIKKSMQIPTKSLDQIDCVDFNKKIDFNNVLIINYYIIIILPLESIKSILSQISKKSVNYFCIFNGSKEIV